MPRASRQPEITHGFALELLARGLATSHEGAVRMAQRARKEGSRHHEMFSAWLKSTAAGALGAKPKNLELTALRLVGKDTPPESEEIAEPSLMDTVESPPEGMSDLRWMATCQMRTWRFADQQLKTALKSNNEVLAAHYTRLMPQLHASVQAAEKAALEYEERTRHLIPAADIEEATRTVIVPLGMTVSNLRAEIVTLINDNLASIMEQRGREWEEMESKPTMETWLKTIAGDALAVMVQAVKQWQRDRYQPALQNTIAFLRGMGPAEPPSIAA